MERINEKIDKRPSEIEIKRARLSLKYKEIDIDQIKVTNFIPIMRFKLLTEPEKRQKIDIEILKKCTSFLSFFENIIRMDPDDKRKAHENGCRLLRYRIQKKVQLLQNTKIILMNFT